MNYPMQTFHSADQYPQFSARLRFDPLFVNEQRFVALKKYMSIKVFWSQNAANEVLGRMVFAKSEKGWLALLGSPFGGLEYTDDLDIENFLKCVVGCFDRVTELQLVNYPSIYGSYDAQLESVHFRHHRSEINHHIDLGEPVAVHKMQLRRFNKCENAGFRFGPIGNATEQLTKLHGFISECRKERGIEINISLEDFIAFNQAFPNAYLRYGVWHGHDLIAATVLVVMKSQIIYNYLPASLTAYSRFSPMVFLLLNIMELLKSRNFRYLDLGISSINGVPQHGLCNFKESMGAIRSTKGYYALHRE